MVLWQGLTEGGTAVPVQVTEAGKVVAEGQQGQEGPPGPDGPRGPQGEYGPGDDVDLGSITAAGTVESKPSSSSNGYAFKVTKDGTDLGGYWQDSGGNNLVLKNASGEAKFNAYGNGTMLARGNVTSEATFISKGDYPFRAYNGDTDLGGISRESDGLNLIIRDLSSALKAQVKGDGSITAAGNKAGFTADGELYFTSRGTRYKLEVAGGLCNAIPYTREMELREQVEDKRKPRPTDSVPED